MLAVPMYEYWTGRSSFEPIADEDEKAHQEEEACGRVPVPSPTAVTAKRKKVGLEDKFR